MPGIAEMDILDLPGAVYHWFTACLEQTRSSAVKQAQAKLTGVVTTHTQQMQHLIATCQGRMADYQQTVDNLNGKIEDGTRTLSDQTEAYNAARQELIDERTRMSAQKALAEEQ